MSSYNGAPQPPNNYPGPGAPAPRPELANRKTLFIVLGTVAIVVVLAVIALFVWVIPALTKTATPTDPTPSAVAGQTASSEATSGRGTDTAATEAAATEGASGSAGTETADSNGIPEGAVALPAGWNELAGPSNVPADGDPLFSKFVTGESSFQYLKSWDYDAAFGKITDTESGKEMQQVAQGTKELDADGISTAFAFFAESDEGKFGSDPVKVKAAIQKARTKLTGMSSADLNKQLVGHKCASDFQATTPETREFRRGLAVVVGFTCKTAAGDDIQAVNLFSVTPWGTPQQMGVSGHKTYWDANPGVFEKLANSYRMNKWKQ